MSWDTGNPVSNTPTDYIADRIKNNLGMGSSPLRNWSFVENLGAGTCTAEKQRLVLTGFGAGDTFRLTFNGHETTDIAYNATPNTVQNSIWSALAALPDFSGYGNGITVTAIDITTYDISSSDGNKWFGLAFSIVSSFSVTNAVGCSGSLSQQVAPVGTKSGAVSVEVDVYKCSGSGDDANDCGQDFYIVVRRDKSGTATDLRFCLAQNYSTTWHKLQNPIDRQSGSSTGPDCDANGFPSTNWEFGQWWVPGVSSSAMLWVTYTLNKTGFTYCIKTTKNFISIGTRVGTVETWSYAGLMDSLVVGATDTYPFCHINNSVSYGTGGSFLTCPGVSGAISGIAQSFGGSPSAWTAPARAAINNANNQQDKFANGGIWVARVFICHGIPSTQYYNLGYARGLAKSDILCFPQGGTVQMLDTMTINGNTWTVMGTCGSNIEIIAQAN